MRPLRDRIMETLSRTVRGETLKVLSAEIGVSQPDLRAALIGIEQDGLLRKLRYPGERALRFLPTAVALATGQQVCVMCPTVFEQRRKSKRVTCSKSCALRYAWRVDDARRAKRVAAARAALAAPAERARRVECNRRRWSRPGEREKLSTRNKARWQDPATAISLSVAIKRSHSRDEFRQSSSERMKARWQDAQGRDRMLQGLCKSREARSERMSETNRRRWQDPDYRERMLKVLASNITKAQAANRGKKQSPEWIAKRVQSRRRNTGQD